jgi:5-methylcytosine-specific restriction protein A
MPTRPPKPCAEPRCPTLVPAGQRFCPDHKREHYRRFNAARGTVKEQNYGNTWKKLRDYYIARNVLCVMCLSKGVTRAAEEVDHVTPRRHGGSDDTDNLQSLCKSCHSRKTAREVLNKCVG